MKHVHFLGEGSVLCHKSNFVRGLLCHGCNIGLGAFKDDINNLKSAISYLEDCY